MIFDEIPWPDDSDKPYSPRDNTPDYDADFIKLYGWRDNYYGEYNNGLDPDDYETEKQFLYAVKNPPISFIENIEANTEFIYCGVAFPYQDKVYLYRTENKSIRPGDKVIVPVGEENEEKLAQVVSVDIYHFNDVPYPVHKTKMIIRREG